MNHNERRRFLKMIGFLDELEDSKFFFGGLIAAWEKIEGKECGTLCCVMGWAPFVFPELVEWVKSPYFNGILDIRLIGSVNGFTFYNEVGARLFGIPENIVGYLFHPDRQWKIHPELLNVPALASPKQAAAMMRHFLELWDAGKIV